MKKKINNYRFQQQQQARQQYQKVKKIKEKWEKMPVDATEELDYIKKLLNGEDVEDFGPKEEKVEITLDNTWSAYNSKSYSPNMSLSDYLNMMGGKGYYR